MWWALAAGSAAVFASALLILAPSVTVLAATGSAGPFLRVPVGAIVLVVALAYGLSVTMIALTLRSQRTALAWLCAAAGALIAVGASAYPLAATAMAIAQEMGGFLPALEHLISPALRG